jgi:hypothetical protein
MPYSLLNPHSKVNKNLERTVGLKPSKVKLPAHRTGLPGNEILFHIVPLDPAYKAGLTGHLPANYPD